MKPIGLPGTFRLQAGEDVRGQAEIEVRRDDR